MIEKASDPDRERFVPVWESPVKKAAIDKPTISNTSGAASRRRRKLKRIIARDGSNCVFCGLHCPEELGTIEHFIPACATSELPDLFANLVLAHKKCNEVAGNQSVQEKIALIIEMRRRVALLQPVVCKST